MPSNESSPSSVDKAAIQRSQSRARVIARIRAAESRRLDVLTRDAPLLNAPVWLNGAEITRSWLGEGDLIALQALAIALHAME